MILDDAGREELAAEVAKRVAARAHGGGGRPLTVFLNVSENDPARAAGKAIRRVLEALRGGVAFSTKITGGGAPVPSGEPGGHVHTLTFRLDPRPDLIVDVSTIGERICAAGRDPGPDPSADPTSWLWILYAPPNQPE
jgi:hypothetical protein